MNLLSTFLLKYVCYKPAQHTIVTIRCLNVYRSIANLFNVSKSTAWDVTMRVCRAIIDVNQEDNIIAWPCGQKALDVITDFERTYGFPGMLCGWNCIASDGKQNKIA